MPVTSALELTPYDEGICSYLFENTNTTINIYGDKSYGYNLIEGTKGIYSYEIFVSGDKSEYVTPIQTHSEIVCGDTIIQKNGSFKSYPNLTHKQNITKFIFNGTFLVPKYATSCIVRAQIYGFKDNRNTKCSGNCACEIYGLSSEKVSKEKEIWTRDEYFMSKWADELKTSNDEQRKQNRDSTNIALIGSLIIFLTALWTAYQTNEIHKEKIMMEHNENIYSPILLAIDYCRIKTMNFSKIHNSYQQKTNIGHWIDIFKSKSYPAIKYREEKLFNRIEQFFDRFIPNYDTKVDNVITELNKLTIFLKTNIHTIRNEDDINYDGFNDILSATILKKDTASISIYSDGTDLISVPIKKNELKKINSKINKLPSLKNLELEQKKVLKEANDIKTELNKKLKTNEQTYFQKLKHFFNNHYKK